MSNGRAANLSSSSAGSAGAGSAGAGSAGEALQAQLQSLRDAYAARLPEKVERLEELCKAIPHIESGGEIVLGETPLAVPEEEENLHVAHRLAHNLAGSGATYGFPDLSRAARALEQHFKGLLAGALPVTSSDYARAEELLASLRNAINPHQEHKSAPEPTPLELPKNELQEHLASGESPWRQEDSRLVFLALDSSELAQDLSRQISYFGYAIEVYDPPPKAASVATSVEDLYGQLSRNPPCALIIDTALYEGADSASSGGEETVIKRAVSRFQEKRKSSDIDPVPVLYVSSHGDLSSRLRAVRANGAAYFTKPVDAPELIDELDQLTAQEAPDPYRVLIVDDEPDLADFFAWTLQGGGIQTRIVNDPLQIMTSLMDYRPDLILMDVYMPVCSGLELATVIRQQQDYVGVPIVFLSAETDIQKQMAAMNLGGDDFLTKPIRPDHLLASVTARARRSRALRSFMVRDSLTGLLNHTTTKEQLMVEVSRAERTRTPFSFAMLDIDRFKSVNDTYGHLVGDRVIKNLARLLQQRLRKTDIVGRYGGEEFAVLLAGADGLTAYKILDEIRVGFSQVRQQAAGREFTVTLSAGIATFPSCDSAAKLNDCADKALYQAKRDGRNRIVMGEACSTDGSGH